ncbi:MAG: hypothetical protein P1P74_06835 [Desulfuromonadales bacterium]|nr:hypothetical protein [Desulfuromonadales bacterium]
MPGRFVETVQADDRKTTYNVSAIIAPTCRESRGEMIGKTTVLFFPFAPPSPIMPRDEQCND